MRAAPLYTMKLSKEEVEHVAWLARLELSEDEKERLMGHLNQIMVHFEKLQELDTTDVEPTSHVIPVSNVSRRDESRPSLPPEEVVSNGPQVADNCFVVPRVVET